MFGKTLQLIIFIKQALKRSTASNSSVFFYMRVELIESQQPLQLVSQHWKEEKARLQVTKRQKCEDNISIKTCQLIIFIEQAQEDLFKQYKCTSVELKEILKLQQIVFQHWKGAGQLSSLSYSRKSLKENISLKTLEVNKFIQPVQKDLLKQFECFQHQS